jgi:hypothetical protein
MARRHEAEQHLRNGLCPLSIAHKMEVSIRTVIPYLFIRVGEGGLTLSDIYYSIPENRRSNYEALLERRTSTTSLIDESEFHLYRACRDSVMGDMYLQLRRLEITLHRMIQCALEMKHAQHDDQWWVEGVPLDIRKSCQERREEDRQRLDAYAYTNLIHLKVIIERNWAIFKEVLPDNLAVDKGDLMRRLDRLNQIRNDVMHPIKLVQPTADSFKFVRSLGTALEESRWRFVAKNE